MNRFFKKMICVMMMLGVGIASASQSLKDAYRQTFKEAYISSDYGNIKHCYDGQKIKDRSLNDHLRIMGLIQAMRRDPSLPITSAGIEKMSEKVLERDLKSMSELFQFQSDPCGMRETNQLCAGPVPPSMVTASLVAYVEQTKKNRERFGSAEDPSSRVVLRDVSEVIGKASAKKNIRVEIQDLEKEFGLS